MSTEVQPEAIEPEVLEPMKSNQLVKLDARPDAVSPFESIDSFRAAQSMALALCTSTIVPAAYRGQANIGNCLVAMETANRMGLSVLAVMQNLHVIEGKPAWASAFVIGRVNSCGRFTPLRFEWEGEERKSGWGCRAIATDIKTGAELPGTWITWDMAQKEGWVTRAHSKWQSMPAQMIVYRAASFWGRIYAPDLFLGLHTVDEVEDITERTPSVATQTLNAALKGEPSAEVRPSVNVLDVACEACGAKPWKEHGTECPHA